MTATTPSLSERAQGWLRFVHRKAHVADDWSRSGRPDPIWDATTGEPMTNFHRFDLVESTYAVALMAEVTPAWREVYAGILDRLCERHTSWWAAVDWLTMLGTDPARGDYPDWYRLLVPERHWGDYNAPGWTGNGLEPWGLQMDPIGADGNLFFKGFFNLMLGLHRAASGDPKWDRPFEVVREEGLSFAWTHSRVASHLAGQIASRSAGCHCENTKIWPY